MRQHHYTLSPPLAHLARGHGVRAGVEENTSTLRAVEVSELGAVRPLEARRLENKWSEGLKRVKKRKPRLFGKYLVWKWKSVAMVWRYIWTEFSLSTQKGTTMVLQHRCLLSFRESYTVKGLYHHHHQNKMIWTLAITVIIMRLSAFMMLLQRMLDRKVFPNLSGKNSSQMLVWWYPTLWEREREKGRLNADFNMPRPCCCWEHGKIQTNKEIHKHSTKEIQKGFDPIWIRSCRALRICGVLNMS